MKENEKIMRKTLSSASYDSLEEEFLYIKQEDKEIYLFIRGGFAAK